MLILWVIFFDFLAWSHDGDQLQANIANVYQNGYQRTSGGVFF